MREELVRIDKSVKQTLGRPSFLKGQSLDSGLTEFLSRNVPARGDRRVLRGALLSIAEM